MPYQIYLRPAYSNELYHHGIKGQKWGVRRFQNPDGTLTAAGKIRYGIKSDKKVKTPDNEKGALAVLALFGLTTFLELAPVISISAAARSKEKKANKFEDNCEKEREEAVVDKKTGLKKQTTAKSAKEDLKRVNPGYHTSSGSTNGSHDNCVNCTYAYELRRRGYEVQAKRNDTGRSGKETAKKYFKGVKHKGVVSPPKYNEEDQDEFLRFYERAEKAKAKGNKELIQKVNEAMASEPPGSRGQVLVRWSKYSGHSTSYEVLDNGKWRIMEAQNGKIYEDKALKALLQEMCSFEYARLDNLEFDAKAIKEAVR